MNQKRLSFGFTLAELLIVTAILGFAISVILLTFVNSLALNEASRNLVTATSHAELVLESIKNTPFTSMKTDITNGNWTWNNATIVSNGLTPLNSESLATTVTGTNPLDISVVVSWKDTRGRNRTQTLRTLLSG